MTASHGSARELWIDRKASAGPTRTRLLCFPYAGGGTSIFRDWPAGLGPGIEVCAVRLPGREHRLNEPALRRVEDVVAHLHPRLLALADRPLALFGHSMGALLAFEVARALERAGVRPAALMVSGRRAPHLPPRKRDLHALPRAELIEELRALGGTPPDFFRQPELVELLLPMLRCDLELVERHRADPAPKLSCPVVAFGGDRDPDVPRDDLDAWRAVAGGRFSTRMFAGDHFYLGAEREALLGAVGAILSGPGAGEG